MAKNKTSLIPKSKAKTAYGLLSEIAALVRDEPRRMRMQNWQTPVVDLETHQVPACGTVCCIGGWVDTLKPSMVQAADILGIDSAQEQELFFGPLCRDATQGTPLHATRVVAMIRKFQKKHAAQLKAKRV